MAANSSANKTRKIALAVGAFMGITLFVGVFGWALFQAAHPRGFHLVDLGPYYNAGTTNSTLNPFTMMSKNNLANLPTGTNRFGDIPFAVGGIIQLGNRDYQKWLRRYPPAVTNIVAGYRCRALHLLHGTGFNAGGSHKVIAYLELRYEDDTTAKIPIVYARHAHDWWYGKEITDPLDPGTEIAWRGTNPDAAAKNQKLRVFKSTFANPHPEKRIQTIDYVSTLSACAPFMLGLTLEL